MGGVPKLYEFDRSARCSEIARSRAIAIARCFGSGQPEPSEADLGITRTTLDQIRDKGFWISCGCRDGDDAAVMFPAKREGTLYLRFNGPGQHAADCPFWKPLIAAQGAPSPRTGLTRVEEWTGGWNVGSEAGARVSTTDASDAQSGRNRSTQPRLPRLGRMLLSALHRARLNRVHAADLRMPPGQAPRAKDVAEFYQRLSILDADTIAPGVEFKDIHVFTLKKTKWLLHAVLPKLEQTSPLPGRKRHTGFFMGIVDSVEAGKGDGYLVHVDKEGVETRIRIEGRIHLFGRDKGNAGPYYVLAHALKPPGSQKFAFVKAYAHPVYSAGLPIPVDSGLEREMLATILRSMVKARMKHRSSNPELMKPVLDVCTADGKWCRPDFVVIADSAQRLVLECMGSDDEDYLRAKEGTHPLMRGLPHVGGFFPYVPGEDDPKALESRIMRFLDEQEASAGHGN